MNALEAASLVMIPSGYEDGTLGSLKPTDGTGDFTFTRGSNISATRVNADGNIEKGYENLLTYSNDFSNVAWKYNNVNVSEGQAGYNGTNNAWLLEKETSSTDRIQYLNLSSSGVQTFSVYAKANTATQMSMYIGGIPNGATFDLITGSYVGNFAAGAPIFTKIEPIGNDGWYRISAVVNGNVTDVRVYPDINADAGGSIYIQDAMLNQGLVAYPYVETTTAPVAGGILEDMPRLDYSNGSCPSLLLEPSRTNLVPNSEYLSSWVNEGTTNSYNEIVSPEGLQNAFHFKEDTSTGGHIVYKIGISTQGVYSVFAKGDGSGRLLGLRRDGGTGANSAAWFDLDNGEIVTNGELEGTASIEPYSNGWYRCIFIPTSANGTLVLSLSNGSGTQPYRGVQYTGDGVSGVYLYGVQLESASYPTSYIPTYGVSQTRLRDDCQVSDVASLIGQTEGVFYVNIESLTTLPTGEYRFINLENDFANRITLGYFNNSDLFVEIKTNNVTELYYRNTTPSDQKNKMTIAYRENDCRVFINGQKVYTDNSVTLPTQLNKLSLNTGPFKFYGKVDGILTFPTALSDEACIELTTI